MAKTTKTFTKTGFVDSTALFYEYGECDEPLQVFDTIDALAKKHKCINCGGEYSCYPVEVAITYTIEVDD
jgi:hypothetical protein